MAEISGAGNQPRVVAHSPAADQDLSAIYTYTLQQWGRAQAENYLDFLDEVMSNLAHNPAIAPAVENMPGTRSFIARWPSSKQGHRIFFEETSRGILVLRILHTAMRWQDQLGQ